jgi:hypothetical protein
MNGGVYRGQVTGASPESLHGNTATKKRPMTHVAHVPGFVMAVEANRNSFSFCLVTLLCKPRNGMPEANRNFRMP